MSKIKNGREETHRAIRWLKDGKFHREGDLPSIEYFDGTKEWYINGLRHRDGGKPAVERFNGTKEWWFEGKPHREEGPAVEFPDNLTIKIWWIHGVQYTEEEFDQYINKKLLNDSLKLNLEQKKVDPKIKVKI